MGLPGSGKTTIMKKLSENNVIEELGYRFANITHKGFNIVLVEPEDYERTVQKMGSGTQGLRSHHVLFVVDSTDRVHLNEAKKIVQKISQDEMVVKSFIYANKQDLPNAMTREELIQIFEQPCAHIQLTCATTGDGLSEGLDYFTQEAYTVDPSPIYLAKYPHLFEDE